MISPLRNMRLKLAHHVSMREIKDRVATLVLGASSLALALAPIFFLFWLMQPKVLANPGIGALRVAGAASYEPFLHDAEPPQSAEPPRRESAARLTQHDPQYREAAISAQRVSTSRLAPHSRARPSNAPTASRNIRAGIGAGMAEGTPGRTGLRYLRLRRNAVKRDRTLSSWRGRYKTISTPEGTRSHGDGATDKVGWI